MGIQIKGSNDTISSADGSIVLEGATLTFTNETVSGISTMASAEVTGNLSIADKIIHTGDTNTAIRFPAADTLTVETAGSERIRIDDNGRIGIGTLSPYSNSLLHCDGNLVLTASGNAPKIIFDEFGTGTDPKAQIEMDQESSTAASMRFYTEGSGTLTERMRILSDGKIGIGTAVPGNALELYGTSSSVQIAVDGTGRYRGFEIHEGGTRKAYFQHDATDNCALLNTAESDLKFYTGDTQRMQLDGSGRLMIGNTAAANLYSVANNLVVGSGSGSEGITIYSDSTNDGFLVFADGQSDPAYRIGQIIYSHQQNKFHFRTNGNTDRLLIDNAGNVNISGVTTATAFLPSGAEQQLSHRNIWINGDASVAQKGTSIASLTSTSGYVAGGPDRTYVVVNNHGTWTLAQGTDAPPGFHNCVQMTATTGDGSLAADAQVRWWQRWEGRDMQRFMKGTSSAKEFALSFWVKSATTGDYAVELLDYDNSTRGVTRTYTINAADTWEHKKVILPADTTGAFDNDTAASFACEFWICAGSNYTSGGADASWHTYSDGKRAGGHTANAGASNNDYVRITGIQLEAGSHCTPYEHRSYSDELIRCQRYFQAYPHDDNSVASGLRLNGDFSSVYQTPMRDVPTGTVYGVGGISGANNGKYDKDGVGNVTASIETKHSGFEIDTDGGVGLAAVTLDSEV